MAESLALGPADGTNPAALGAKPRLASLMSLNLPVDASAADAYGGRHFSQPPPAGPVPDLGAAGRHLSQPPPSLAISPTRQRAMSDSFAHSSYLHSFQAPPAPAEAPPPPQAYPYGYALPSPPTLVPGQGYGPPPPMPPPLVAGPQHSPQGPPVRLFMTAHRVSMARYGAMQHILRMV